MPVPEIAKKLIIKTGKNKGPAPSVASVYRALAEAEQHDDGPDAEDLPTAPARTRIRRPGEPLTAEETDLRDASSPSGSQSRPHDGTEGSTRRYR